MQKKIDEFLKATQKAFKFCSVRTKTGLAFYASDPKGRYPWIFPRDLACIANSLLELGDIDKVKRICLFLLSIQSKKDGHWDRRYTKRGEAIKETIQEDNTPLALWIILSYIKKAKDVAFFKKIRPRLKKGFYWIENYNKDSLSKLGLVYSHYSIHEAFSNLNPLNPKEYVNEGYEIWNNSVTARAFFLMGELSKEEKYNKIAKRIKIGIGKYLVKRGRFLRRLNNGLKPDFSPDMITLSPLYFDLFSKKERVKGLTFAQIISNTISYLYQNLWDKTFGGFFRYPTYLYLEKNPKYSGIVDHKVPGRWIFYTGWMAQAHFKLNQKKKALKLISWILNIGKNGLLSESVVLKNDFQKYRQKEWEYHQVVKDGEFLKIAKKSLGKMEKQAQKNKILYYIMPLLWSHAETLRALKMANLIKEFKLSL